MVPKVLQSDPKGLQNGALGGHFDYFFCKKPTLHPTAYLLCFRHILEVLGPPVLKKFLVEMCVGSRSPTKAVTLSLFLIFRRKCVKMGAHIGVGEGPKNRLFLICPPLGVPGFIFLDFWPPWASFWAFFEGRPAPATDRCRCRALDTGNPNLKPTWLQRGGGVGRQAAG